MGVPNELSKDALPGDLTADKLSNVGLHLGGDRAPGVVSIRLLGSFLEDLTDLALGELPVLLADALTVAPALVAVTRSHALGELAHHLIEGILSLLTLPLHLLDGRIIHELPEVPLGALTLRETGDKGAELLVAADLLFRALGGLLCRELWESPPRDEATLRELILRDHRVDGKVGRPVVNPVGIVAAACRVKEDEVEALMLQEPSDLAVGEARAELPVPPHGDLGALLDDTRRGDLKGLDLRQAPDDVRVERVVPGKSDEVTVHVEACETGRINDLLRHRYIGGGARRALSLGCLCHLFLPPYCMVIPRPPAGCMRA